MKIFTFLTASIVAIFVAKVEPNFIQSFIETDSLPGHDEDSAYNYRQLPELSNGVIGTTVYNESLYLAGMYRFAKIAGSNRDIIMRLRVPNYVMFRFGDVPNAKRTFLFNITQGLWEERLETDQLLIRSIMAAHATFPRTFFNYIKVSAKTPTTGGQLTIPLSQRHADMLADSHFAGDLYAESLSPEPLKTLNGVQRTFAVRSPADGSEQKIVVLSNSQQARRPNEPYLQLKIDFGKHESDFEILLLQTTAPGSDKSLANAEYQLAAGYTSNPAAFVALHTSAWEGRFNEGNLVVASTFPKLQTLIHGSLYQIYSQFPFDSRNTVFYGVSASGLGRGGALTEFAGHVTPDQELFVFPVLSILHPELARRILFYRVKQLRNNKRFPVAFEAARSGLAIDPLWCDHCHNQSMYSTGLLGMAVRQYYTIIGDQVWATLADAGGFDILDQIAAKRIAEARLVKQNRSGIVQISKIESTGVYRVSGVCGPDELHRNQSNNLLTNTLTVSSLLFWDYLRCVTNKPAGLNRDLIVDFAKKLSFPIDVEKQTTQQFDGFDAEPDRTISQADALLAYHPAGLNVSKQMLNNDLPKYNSFKSATGIPATSLAVRIIAQLSVGTEEQVEKARQDFELLTANYVTEPFLNWQNLTILETSAVGHLGSASAFLSTLISGFAGLKMYANRLDLNRPVLPLNVSSLILERLHFNGGEFDYSFDAKSARFKGSGFGSVIDLYDRQKNSFEKFKDKISLPLTPPPKSSRNVLLEPVGVAPFSLVAYDANAARCRLDGAILREQRLPTPVKSTAASALLQSYYSSIRVAVLLNCAIMFKLFF